MNENITHEVLLDALDDEELAGLIKAREGEPTIRVSVEDLSGRDETDSTGGLK